MLAARHPAESATERTSRADSGSRCRVVVSLPLALPSLEVPSFRQRGVVLQGRHPAVPANELAQGQVDGVLLGLRAGQSHGLVQGVFIDVDLRQCHHEPPSTMDDIHNHCTSSPSASAAYRSRTSRSVQDRDTQIIMQSPVLRSSCVSTESRWSGTPPSTVVSQVPQVPSAQDDRTPTPDSSTTSRIERSGGIVRVSSLAASFTSKASARTGAVSGRALNRSTRSDRGGQARQRSSTAASKGSGPQQ